MRDRNGVAAERVIPFADADRHRGVAFSVRRRESPLVALAHGDRIRPARLLFRKGEALPASERDFREPRILAVGAGVESGRGASQFHRLAGAAERAGYEIELRLIDRVARQQISQNLAAAARLPAAARVDRNVALALQTPFDIPVGFAMTDVIEPGRRAHRSRSIAT